MEPTPAIRFAHDLLRAGLTLTDLADDLMEGFGDRDPWPGEDTGAVLVQMLTGSIATALEHVPEDELDAARELLEVAVDAVLADLERAIERRARPARPRARAGRPSCRR